MPRFLKVGWKVRWRTVNVIDNCQSVIPYLYGNHLASFFLLPPGNSGGTDPIINCPDAGGDA